MSAWMEKCVHVFVLSHHLVLLPRSLEVHAAIFSALDDCPSAAGCFHSAVDLCNVKRTEREGWKVLRMKVMEH